MNQRTLIIPTSFEDIASLAEGLRERVNEQYLMLYAEAPCEENEPVGFQVLLADQSVAFAGAGRAISSYDGGEERPPSARFDIVLDSLVFEGTSEVVYDRILMVRNGEVEGADSYQPSDSAPAPEGASMDADGEMSEVDLGSASESPSLAPVGDDDFADDLPTRVGGEEDLDAVLSSQPEPADSYDGDGEEDAMPAFAEDATAVVDLGELELVAGGAPGGPTTDASAASDPQELHSAPPEELPEIGSEAWGGSEPPPAYQAEALSPEDAMDGGEAVDGWGTPSEAPGPVDEGEVHLSERPSVPGETFDAVTHVDPTLGRSSRPPAGAIGTPFEIEDVGDGDSPLVAPVPSAPEAPLPFSVRGLNGGLSRPALPSTWNPDELTQAKEVASDHGVFAYPVGELPVPASPPPTPEGLARVVRPRPSRAPPPGTLQHADIGGDEVV
ncbi:MAG: hypothetical protein KC416_06300, partial [Myxococcales bacterium]|nr:hypothetical protein [Myxococcales bacterium]